MKIAPQPGPQTQFLSTQADIAIYGGGAGGGKSWALVADALRFRDKPGFSAVVFRRTVPELTAPGGIFEQSMQLYSRVARVTRSPMIKWEFKSGATVRLSHMETLADRLAWSGSAVTGLYFDELQTFEAEQFEFLLSRNRTTCDVEPYVRATCNPDPDSFVARLVEWWIDGITGLPIIERSGVLRWFCRDGDDFVWADSADALRKRVGDDCAPKSFTFIPARVYDNKVLMEKNPGYVDNLKLMSPVWRARLLDGNWKVRASAGMLFKRRWFGTVDAVPAGGESIRFWDRAATAGGGDWSVGVRVTRSSDGYFYVSDVQRFQGSPLQVERAIVNTATRDGTSVKIRLEEQPGSAGKMEAGYLIRQLAGFDVKAIRATGDKQERARPASSQCEAGNVFVVRAGWNDAFFNELENFPQGKHDDQVDAFAGALNELAQPLFKVFCA